MTREYDQFVEDIKFISKDYDNWIFRPLYEVARRLVVLYKKIYDEV